MLIPYPSLQTLIDTCDKCSKAFAEDDALKKVEPLAPDQTQISPLLSEKERTIRDLELELAQTKLALVESECKVQDLTHELTSAIGEIQESKNTWFQKTLTSIREVTTSNKKDGGIGGGGGGVALAKSSSRDELQRKNSKDHV